jgi:hypothetical protein
MSDRIAPGGTNKVVSNTTQAKAGQAQAHQGMRAEVAAMFALPCR